MEYIKNLPEELQRKILLNAMVHPVATLIKNIRKHYDITQFEVCYDVDKHNYYTLSLYDLLITTNTLKNPEENVFIYYYD